MDNLWTFFDRLDEIVYAIDMNTHHLIYLNRRALQEFGLSGIEEARDTPCYALFHKKAAPCPDCSSRHLQSGEFLSWQQYSETLQRPLSLKATRVTVDGKPCRICMAFDLTTEETLSQGLRDYAFNEAVLNRGMELALAEDDPDRSIDLLLEFFGNQYSSDRAYLFEQLQEGGWDNTHEWCAQGVNPEMSNLQGIPDSPIAFWIQRFYQGENIIIRDIEDLALSEPLLYTYLKPQGIHSLVVSPILDRGKLLGFFGVDNPPTERMNHISTLFQITGHFFTFLLRRRNLLRRLNEMSFRDQLTGLGNRHAMHDFLSSLNHTENIALVYCDIMGLKQTNDYEGHHAGDDLLHRAAACLRAALPDFRLFRVGGDEFLAIASQIEAEQLSRRVQQLRMLMPTHRADMAVGAVWTATLDRPFHKILLEADRRMYQDKRNFYSHRKNDRRNNRRSDP